MTSTVDIHYKKMTETPVSKLIIRLGIPTTISMLVTSIYNLADTYFVGRLGPSAQGAISVLFTLQCIIQAVAFMLGHGSGVFVAKYLADKNVKRATEFVSSAFYLSVLLGTLFMAVGLIIIKPFMLFLGSTETILPYAVQYGACVLIATPFIMGSFVLNNCLRYEGKAFYAMIGLVSGGLLNILGDFLLVYVFDFGVLGAGIATAVSQMVSFVLLLILYKKFAQSQTKIKAISKNFKDYLRIMKIGLPSFIRQGLTSISGGILNNLSKPYGDATIAAMGVVNKYTSVIAFVGLGIGQGFQPVASFNYQAKRFDRVKNATLFTALFGTALVSILSIPGIAFPSFIISLFQKDVAVISVGTLALRIASIGVIVMPVSIVTNMLFQSTFQAGKASFLSMLRSGLAFIPTLILFENLFGIVGIQISQPVADLISSLISLPFLVYFLLKGESKCKNS
jgi:putative MATE family efflux protein